MERKNDRAVISQYKEKGLCLIGGLLRRVDYENEVDSLFKFNSIQID